MTSIVAAATPGMTILHPYYPRRMELASRYTRVAVVLHWVVAATVLAQVPLGWWMQEIPRQPPGPRAEMFNLHKSIGLTVLALMVVRLAWRLGHKPPALPPMPHWQAIAAKATHWALYFLVVALPLSGYVGSVYSGFPVKVFGIDLPAWGAKDPHLKEWMGSAHLFLSWALLAALALHVAGVIKHAIIDRDAILTRMGMKSWTFERQ